MAQRAKTRIAAKGRVVIPSSFRDALGWKEGDEVQLMVDEHGLRISTLENRIAEAQKYVRSFVKEGRSLSSELIQERRKEARRE